MLLSFLFSYPEEEKNDNKILWFLYIFFNSLKTGRPCSYSPREATWIQMYLSVFEIFFSNISKTLLL